MSIWDTYPAGYRSHEVRSISTALQSGECVSVVGLSGSGKSNLMGFLAHRVSIDGCRLIALDCNRLAEHTTPAFLRFIRCGLRDALEPGAPDDCPPASNEWAALDKVVARALAGVSIVCLLFDRFDALPKDAALPLSSNLRALRDAHKFELAFVLATRRPLPQQSELAELFFANTVWLGPLDEADARWNVERFTARKGLAWDEDTTRRVIELSRGYPSMLRAVCEAHAAGVELSVESMSAHPAVQSRVDEFWADQPSAEELRLSGLTHHPLLAAHKPLTFDTSFLTAKENLLLNYFLAHPDKVCEKDELIRAVWPEDKIYQQGIRDDSLAQLVRRLREKIEPDPSAPQYVHTVAGRGYRFTSR